MKTKRNQIIKFMNKSEENFNKVYMYLNGNLCQCWTDQAEYIISSPDELPNESVKELYDYIFS